MMSMIILGCTCIVITLAYMRYDDQRCKSFDTEREHWNKERQQLLDRIQAPSFDHLKQAEVRVIKASKEPAKEPNTLEVV